MLRSSIRNGQKSTEEENLGSEAKNNEEKRKTEETWENIKGEKNGIRERYCQEIRSISKHLYTTFVVCVLLVNGLM